MVSGADVVLPIYVGKTKRLLNCIGDFSMCVIDDMLVVKTESVP